jgi:hypothetical protein
VRPTSCQASCLVCRSQFFTRPLLSRHCATLRPSKPPRAQNASAPLTFSSKLFSRSDMLSVRRRPNPQWKRSTNNHPAWQCIDSLVFHFIRYAAAVREVQGTGPRSLPVIFHQCMLVFAQRYRNDSTSTILIWERREKRGES